MKISVVGAGNVGATLAMRTVEEGLGDVVLIDVVDGLAKGKAIDISDASPITGHECRIYGTQDFGELKKSDIVVITAGLARKPGMSRDDLIFKNAAIIKDVTEKIITTCSKPIIIVVTNPLDVMSYYAWKVSGLPKSRVMGMAGTLDEARFVNIISEELNCPRAKVSAFVLGCHGDTMVPILSKTFVDKKPILESISKDKLNAIVLRTQNRGAEVVNYLKTGSAYYSPSAGVIKILRAIKADSEEILPVSAYLEGEYGLNGIFLGVPANIGRNGINGITEFELSSDEKSSLSISAAKTSELIEVLKNIK